jgi:hypothetical protein
MLYCAFVITVAHEGEKLPIAQNATPFPCSCSCSHQEDNRQDRDDQTGRKTRPPRLDTERQWLTHSTLALKSYPPLWSTSSFSVLSASLFSFTTHLLCLRTGYKAFAGPVADLPFPFAWCTAGIFYLTRQASAVTEQQKAALKEKGMYDCQLSLNFSV